ncbi:MAG: class I SAM-dependent methyltransferase [Cyanobacteria bacterium P01_E01_bin.42]
MITLTHALSYQLNNILLTFFLYSQSMNEYSYDRIAHIYDRTRPLPPEISEQIGDRILELVGATPETTFLEPGIGTGRTALPIIKKGYDYTGLDASENMMQELRQKVQNIDHKLTLIQGDAAALPFADNTFDVVLTTHILHLLPDWMAALTEIQRVLKPTGIYLACENLLTPHQLELENVLRGILERYNPAIPARREEGLKLAPFGENVKWMLIKRRATVEQIVAVQWQVEQTLGELLKIYEMRAFGLCWQVSETDYKKALQAFKSYCLETYKSEDFVLASAASFEIVAAKNWG